MFSLKSFHCKQSFSDILICKRKKSYTALPDHILHADSLIKLINENFLQVLQGYLKTVAVQQSYFLFQQVYIEFPIEVFGEGVAEGLSSKRLLKDAHMIFLKGSFLE